MKYMKTTLLALSALGGSIGFADNDWHCDKLLRDIMVDFEDRITNIDLPVCDEAGYFEMNWTTMEAMNCNSGVIFDPISSFGPPAKPIGEDEYIKQTYHVTSMVSDAYGYESFEKSQNLSAIYFKENGAIVIGGPELGKGALNRACYVKDNAY